MLYHHTTADRFLLSEQKKDNIECSIDIVLLFFYRKNLFIFLPIHSLADINPASFPV